MASFLANITYVMLGIRGLNHVSDDASNRNAANRVGFNNDPNKSQIWKKQ